MRYETIKQGLTHIRDSKSIIQNKLANVILGKELNRASLQ